MSKIINYNYSATTKPTASPKKPSKKASTRRTRKGSKNAWKAEPSSTNQQNALLNRFGLPKHFTKALTKGQCAVLRLL